MNISTREMTTADVVLSPTPFAPPPVVYPHEQLTCTQNSTVNSGYKHIGSRHTQALITPVLDPKHPLSMTCGLAIGI